MSHELTLTLSPSVDRVAVLGAAECNLMLLRKALSVTIVSRDRRITITGDMTQADLPDPLESGLADAVRRLADVPGVACVELTSQDIVRHDLVHRVVEAYREQADAGDTERDAASAPLQSARRRT